LSGIWTASGSLRESSKNGKTTIDILVKKKDLSKSHKSLNLFGGGERDRTDDLLAASQALSQLSYTPK
jgi:hypothetical protein